MIERVACSVPHCKRSRKPNRYGAYLCPRHWSGVPRPMRRVLFRLHRVLNWSDSFHHRLREARVWRRIVRHAIERAAGI